MADVVKRGLAELAALKAEGASNPELWARQFDLGLAWVHQPVGLGGLALDPAEQQAVHEGLAELGIPDSLLYNVIGIGMASPTLCVHGTAEQQQRWLRGAFSTEDFWCQ